MWQSKLSLSCASTPSKFDGLCTLLDDPSHQTLFRFPPLINAYLTSSREAFDSVLSMTPRSAVDDVDVNGDSALSWAVLRCDSDSVHQLLLRGSDPRHADIYGRTPLHRAVRLDDIACMELLLDAKADVNSRDFNGATALDWAARSQEDTTFMERLLSRGASIENQDYGGYGPLLSAVQVNKVASLQLLLQKGANINAASKNGTTALDVGVRFNAHECLKLLLRDETLELEKSRRYHLLHHAALYGDLKTISLLQSSPRIKKIKLDDDVALVKAKDRRDNNEAWSYWALQPLDKDPQAWYSAFEALWNGILEAQQCVVKGDPEARKGVIEGQKTDDDDADDAEDDDDEEADDEDDDDGDDDDEDDDDEQSKAWEDARQSLDGSPL